MLDVDPKPETTILGEDVKEPVNTDKVDQPSNGNDTDKVEGPWLAQYVGEGKKYTSADEVAKAYAHMEQFIEVLKTEKQQMESKLAEALSKQNTVEEIVTALRDEPASNKDSAQPDNMQDLVSHMVSETLRKKELEQKQKEMEKAAWTTLDEVFGSHDKAKSIVSKYVGDDEGKAAAVKNLGLTDPKALAALLKTVVDDTSDPIVPTEEAKPTRPSSIDPQGITWAKSKQVKKEDPKLYHSREFQVALHKAANENPNFF